MEDALASASGTLHCTVASSIEMVPRSRAVLPQRAVVDGMLATHAAEVALGHGWCE